jgi:hypothetical protein
MLGAPELESMARRAFDWVDSASVEVDGGAGWLEDGALTDDLYVGAAGVLFGCAEATAAGVDAEPLALRARGRLLHLVTENGTSVPDDGLFTGWAGVAVALHAWARVADDDAAAAAAELVLSRIAGRVRASPADPSRYTDVFSGTPERCSR